MSIRRTLRTLALLSLLFVAKCGREPQTEQPYEDPATFLNRRGP